MLKKKKNKKKIRVAIYQCIKCNTISSGKPGPQEDCAKCGSAYKTWINYSQFAIKE
jgi:ssDNA-binding Zn-finger/Zn-ribbon topoisomerase 1